MAEMVFTEEMIETLRTLKGKTFKSYECLREANGRLSSTFGNLRINLGRGAVELRCMLSPIENFIGGPDDVAVFTCASVSLNAPFTPYVEGVAKAYLVNERIRGVEVVRDHVDYNSGLYAFDMDVALVIRTNYHTFAFSHESWFEEAIEILVARPDTPDPGIVPTDTLWRGAEDLSVAVVRERIVL